MRIELMIVDDHPLLINGIQNILQFYKHIVVIGTYTDGDTLLKALEQKQPDVLLLDVLLPGLSGKDIAEIVSKSYPDVQILALTSLDAPSHIEGMMRRGSKGYLLKNTDPQTLVTAIEQVYRGHDYIDPSLKEMLLKNMFHFRKQATEDNNVPILTKRERDILNLIVQGHTNTEIAEKLFLSVRTIENHRFNLLQKLDAKNSIGLIKIAIQMGLV